MTKILNMKVNVYITNTDDLDQTKIDLIKTNFPNKYSKIINYKDKQNQLLSLSGVYLFFVNNPKCVETDIFYGKYGKPLLKTHFFNISHSNKLAVYVDDKDEIGVDIIHIQNKNIDPVINKMHSDEKHLFLEDKLVNFYKVWAQKESVVKLTGDGLSVPLNSFSVTPFAHNKPIIFNNKKIYNYTIKYLDYFISVSARHRINDIKIEKI